MICLLNIPNFLKNGIMKRIVRYYQPKLDLVAKRPYGGFVLNVVKNGKQGIFAMATGTTP